MKKLALLVANFSLSKMVAQKTRCTTHPMYRQFDFWIGEWDAYGLNGKKGGDSKIHLVVDSCGIGEEWTSATTVKGLTYAGKSFIPIMQSQINGSIHGWIMLAEA